MSWQRLVDAIGSVDLKLRPPATEVEIAGAETLFGRALPADYRALLAIADGQEADAVSVFPDGASLLPLAKVIEYWLFNGKFFVREWEDDPVEPDMFVRPCVWHPTRIPIAGDDPGDGPFLDLWPGPAGTVGQVITLVSECDFAVIGTSLDDYFARMANLVIGGQIYLVGNTFERTNRGWVDLVERR